MNYKYLLWIFTASLLTTVTKAADRPNIIWIVLDDLGPELSCYGTSGVETPAMDRLAKAGTRYTNCFSSSPVCSASRSALVTGMSQTSIGAHHHRTRQMLELPTQVKTVMELFQDAGYFVCDMNPPGVSRRVKRDYNFIYSKAIFDGQDWSERNVGQPFFAQVQIHEPHRPFHNNEDPERTKHLRTSERYPDHPLVRADMADYLQSVEIGDELVAKILDRLDKEDLWKNTYVFLFGDHGRPHVWGKQWLYDEGLRVPLIVFNPNENLAEQVDDRLVSLIDIAPASLKVAGIEPHPGTQGVNFLDVDSDERKQIFAARDRCGEAEDRIRAVRTKRFKYIRNFNPEVPYSQLSSYKKLSYPVTTLLEVMHSQKRLKPAAAKMMAATKPPEELYDLHSDPDEICNLASDPDYTTQLASLRAELEHWIETTNDQGAKSEGDLDYQQSIDAEKRNWFEKTMKRRGLSPDISDRQYLEWWKEQILTDEPSNK